MRVVHASPSKGGMAQLVKGQLLASQNRITHTTRIKVAAGAWRGPWRLKVMSCSRIALEKCIHWQMSSVRSPFKPCCSSLSCALTTSCLLPTTLYNIAMKNKETNENWRICRRLHSRNQYPNSWWYIWCDSTCNRLLSFSINAAIQRAPRSTAGCFYTQPAGIHELRRRYGTCRYTWKKRKRNESDAFSVPTTCTRIRIHPLLTPKHWARKATL